MTGRFIMVLVLFCIVNDSLSIIFTTPHKLLSIFVAEEKLIPLLTIAQGFQPGIDNLNAYLESAQHRVEEVKLLENQGMLEEHLNLVMEHLVGNPVHVYCLIDRFRRIDTLIEEIAHINSLDDVILQLKKALENMKPPWMELPGELDMVGVAQNLARIQFTYRFDPKDLAAGVIGGVRSKAWLSVSNCMDIARRRYSGKQPVRFDLSREYALAIEWAEAALQLSTGDENIDYEEDNDDEYEEDKDDDYEGNDDYAEDYKKAVDYWDTSSIEKFLEGVKREHDKHWKSPERNRENYPNEEFFISKFENKNISGRELRLQEANSPLAYENSANLIADYNIHDYNSLCRGELLEEGKSEKLQCFLATRNKSYFLLAPLKMEIISKRPIVYIFHQIITNSEMELMKRLSVPRFLPSLIQDIANPERRASRTQASALLFDKDHPMLYRLSVKTAFMTGLECDTPRNMMSSKLTSQETIKAEGWQVGAYCPGGHYLPHYDYFQNSDPTFQLDSDIWVGNRVATLMFYLSHVRGGFTAFPRIGVATKPRKGSAIFWFNLNENGEPDKRSLHGGCPISLGVKWVATKWIREGAQIWKDPCLIGNRTRE